VFAVFDELVTAAQKVGEVLALSIRFPARIRPQGGAEAGEAVTDNSIVDAAGLKHHKANTE
jgi:hypothetical protein